MSRVLFALLVSLITAHLGQAEEQFPDFYTPEQKARMKKFMAEHQAAMATMTDKERAEVNEFLKGMHEICAATEKKLLYEVDQEAIAKEARLFGESLNWARTASHQSLFLRDDELKAVPARIRALNPSSVIVSPTACISSWAARFSTKV